MRTLEDLKRILRSDICVWCPLGERDEYCTASERGAGDAMCQKAKDIRAEYVWENFIAKLEATNSKLKDVIDSNQTQIIALNNEVSRLKLELMNCRGEELAY